jgi:RNA-directed DNA polymerase
MEKEMRELYIEGVAIHGGPKSCVGACEGVGEALIRVCVGWAMEPRNQRLGVPTPYNQAEGNIADGAIARRQRTLRSENLCMRGISMRENREARRSPVGADAAPPRWIAGWQVGAWAGREGKAVGRKPEMNGRRESDSRVVPAKLADNAGRLAVESVEGRRLDKGNTDRQTVLRTQRREVCASSALDRVRQVAVTDREARFTGLLHHVSVDRLRAAYRALRPTAAAGVDEVTWASYGQDLEAKLQDLHERVQRGAYRAKPSRRVYIPKADGRLRPLGIAALEDKVVQRAVVEVLGAIYEVDFLGFSYGFRPQRGPHDALDALVVGIERKKVNWVLDADIRDFFTSLDQSWLVRFLEHRIADKRVLRLIQKWLNAGVIEDGSWSASEEGAPQGATVTPPTQWATSALR